MRPASALVSAVLLLGCVGHTVGGGSDAGKGSDPSNTPENAAGRGGQGGAARPSNAAGAGGVTTNASSGGVGGSSPGAAGGSPPDRGDQSRDASADAPAGSGLAPGIMLGSLDTPQRRTLCEWGTNAAGGTGKTATCPGGRTVKLPWRTVDMCVASIPAPCGATVADAEACARVILDEPCVEEVPPACKPISKCVLDLATSADAGR